MRDAEGSGLIPVSKAPCGSDRGLRAPGPNGVTLAHSAFAHIMHSPPDITGYRRHWAARFGTAPFLPMSRAEMDVLGWDSCDVIVVTGDAYVDHPSFGMAIVGRVLEAQGFRVGHHRPTGLAQRRCLRRARTTESVLRHHGRKHGLHGQPLHVGSPDSKRRRVHAGRARRQQARSLGHRLRAACAGGVPDVPIVVGGIEASLRRDCALRLLVRESPALDSAGRQGGPARLWQWGAPDLRDRPSAGRRRAYRPDSRTCAAPPLRARVRHKVGSKSTPRTSMRPAR